MRRIEVAELLAGRECRVPGCDNLLDKDDPTCGRYANMCRSCRAGDSTYARAYFESLPAGRRFPEPAETLPAPPRPHDGVPTGKPLTGREEEILFAIADGDSDDEIAAELGLSTATVKTHLKRGIFAKLGARNRTHAVALAYHHGILVPRAR